MLASVTLYVPHAEMTNSRHKFDKLFTPDVNSYQRLPDVNLVSPESVAETASLHDAVWWQ